jgi:hypothetical protein
VKHTPSQLRSLLVVLGHVWQPCQSRGIIRGSVLPGEVKDKCKSCGRHRYFFSRWWVLP